METPLPRKKSSLIALIKKLQKDESEKVLKMKEIVNQKDKRIKELEDQFGITKKKLWENRKMKWWMIWLRNIDVDMYEYLLRIIHHTLLCGGKDGGTSLLTLEIAKKKLKVNRISRYQDLTLNIYGMKLYSEDAWWEGAGGHRCENNQKKEDLIECCKINQINYKQNMKKSELIERIFNHNPIEKSIEEKTAYDLTTEELLYLIQKKKGQEE
tara:strand:- start:1643 stop:2278 length:636 start_codon:yes stop_codon:yes gene_type:complete